VSSPQSVASIPFVDLPKYEELGARLASRPHDHGECENMEEMKDRDDRSKTHSTGIHKDGRSSPSSWNDTIALSTLVLVVSYILQYLEHIQ
jgi:hypothetical protein